MLHFVKIFHFTVIIFTCMYVSMHTCMYICIIIIIIYMYICTYVAIYAYSYTGMHVHMYENVCMSASHVGICTTYIHTTYVCMYFVTYYVLITYLLTYSYYMCILLQSIQLQVHRIYIQQQQQSTQLATLFTVDSSSSTLNISIACTYKHIHRQLT